MSNYTACCFILYCFPSYVNCKSNQGANLLVTILKVKQQGLQRLVGRHGVRVFLCDWLEATDQPSDVLSRLLKPYPADEMAAYPVSRLVN